MKGSDTTESPVDDEVLTAHVAVLGAGQPGYEGCDLFRGAEAPYRNAGGELGPLAFPEDPACEVGLDEPWRDAVGENAVPRDLRSERRGHAVEGKLAGGVRSALFLAHQAEDGRDVDDAPPALSPHAGNDGPAEQEGGS